MHLLILIMLLLFPFPLSAQMQVDGPLIQGGLIRAQVPAGSRVYYGRQQLKVSHDGHFIVGFGRDATSAHNLTLIKPNGMVELVDLQIKERSYKIQRIDNISNRLVNPNPQDLKRIGSEATQARKARQVDSELLNFLEDFIWPADGRISGVYGSQRILNGEPRRPHFGIDIAAPSGTPVIAPAGGRVTLAHQGMFFSGTTLIIDHGHGLSSSFLHLQQILVKPDELIKQGQTIATIGATGRVTGPHLDWRMNWFEQRLDPELLVPVRQK